MPELPEVETIRKGLQEYLIGHTIKAVDIRLPRIFFGDSTKIIGTKVIAVRRFGKGLVIDGDTGYSLAIHVKMTGQLIYQNHEVKIKNHGKVKIIGSTFGTLPAKSTHLIFSLDNDAMLFYNDFRTFGWIKVVKTSTIHEESFFKNLGPEFLKDLTLKQFAMILKSSTLLIKQLLLDQHKMAGLGNIYVNDGLWKAGIDPRRVAKSLSEEEIEKLFLSLEDVLKKGIEKGGASDMSYVNAVGQPGSYQNHFLVYGRKGKPCKRDGTRIEKIIIGGRGTYFCPRCQT